MINRINAMNEPLHPYKLNNVLGGYLDQKFSSSHKNPGQCM